MKTNLLILFLFILFFPALGQKKEKDSYTYKRDTLEISENKTLIRTKTFKNEQLIKDLIAYHIPDSIIRPYNIYLPFGFHPIRVPFTHSIMYIEKLVRNGPYFERSNEGNLMKATYQDGKLVEATYFNSNNDSISFNEFYNIGGRYLHIGQGKPQYELDKNPEEYLMNYYKGKPSKPKIYKKPKPQKKPKN